MVFWIPSIYFSDFIDCDDFDYQDSVWKHGWSMGSLDIFWNNPIHDKYWAKATKLYSKMDQHEYRVNDWTKLNFK